MKRSLPLRLLAIALCVSSPTVGQTKRPTPPKGGTDAAAPATSSPYGTKVLFHAPIEYGCNLAIDGEKIAGIDADQIFQTRLDPGEHILQCVNTTRTVVPLKWKTTQKIERGDQIVINIQIHPSITPSEAASYVQSGRLTLKTKDSTTAGRCDNGESAWEYNPKCAMRVGNIPAHTLVSLANNEPKQIGGYLSFLISVEGVRLWYPVVDFSASDGSIEFRIAEQ